MDTEKVQFPEILLDWLDTRPFNSLDNTQQTLVLQHMTQYEYSELHLTSAAIRLGMQAGSTSSYQSSKKTLMQQFDDTYHKSPGFTTYIHVLWKIAAVFLLFAAGWLSHYLAGYKQNDSGISSLIDTVYVEKKSTEVIRIFDTVYLEEKPSENKNGKSRTRIPRLMQESRDATFLIPPRQDAIPVGMSNHPVFEPEMNYPYMDSPDKT